MKVPALILSLRLHRAVLYFLFYAALGGGQKGADCRTGVRTGAQGQGERMAAGKESADSYASDGGHWRENDRGG